MSRRFGRNQRRRAREALAAEVANVERASMFAQQATKLADERMRMYEHCSRELDKLQGFFFQVARRVGRESILVGGEAKAELDRPEVRVFRAFVRPEFEFHAYPATPKDMECVKYEIMRRLELKAVRDAFAQQIVVRCYLGSAEAGIALSESFLARSTEEEISHRIAQELAQCLAREIKRAK